MSANIVGVNYWARVGRSKLQPVGRIKVFYSSGTHGSGALYANEDAFGYELGDFIKKVHWSKLNDYMGIEGLQCVVFARKESI